MHVSSLNDGIRSRKLRAMVLLNTASHVSIIVGAQHTNDTTDAIFELYTIDIPHTDPLFC
jgi:hypothetical protein